jgi:hypothetical protein
VHDWCVRVMSLVGSDFCKESTNEVSQGVRTDRSPELLRE